MITWLASYPRSGNTLLRIILNQVFEISTFSIYNDLEFLNKPPIAAIVGHQHYEDFNNFIKNAKFSSKRYYVKTHRLPGLDRNRAIYVIRNGKSAIVSHWHYMNEIAGMKISLEDVIRGVGHAAGFFWSGHVSTWVLAMRPNVLLVRYEDLININQNMNVAESISHFTGQPIKNKPNIDFGILHREYQKFFRCGSNEDNLKELSRQHGELFHELHGEIFSTLGYE